MTGCFGFFLKQRLTFSDNSLQSDDIGVRELPHNAGLAQEILPLLLGVAWLQGLDRDGHISSTGSLYHAPKHFPKFS